MDTAYSQVRLVSKLNEAERRIKNIEVPLLNKNLTPLLAAESTDKCELQSLRNENERLTSALNDSYSKIQLQTEKIQELATRIDELSVSKLERIDEARVLFEEKEVLRARLCMAQSDDLGFPRFLKYKQAVKLLRSKLSEKQAWMPPETVAKLEQEVKEWKGIAEEAEHRLRRASEQAELAYGHALSVGNSRSHALELKAVHFNKELKEVTMKADYLAKEVEILRRESILMKGLQPHTRIPLLNLSNRVS